MTVYMVISQIRVVHGRREGSISEYRVIDLTQPLLD